MKKVVITGVNGQLGQHIVKYLLENEPDVEIIGTLRHRSSPHEEFIFDINKIKFELMDLSDAHSIENLIIKYKPEFFINTAANAFVGESWSVPVQHIEINTIGVLHQLEAIRKHSLNTRYFNLGSSEELGVSELTGPQNEDTKIAPKSPYGVSKSAARYLVNVYRKSYGLYALQGFIYNFESKLRGEKYVTRKITKGVARIYNEIKNNKPIQPIKLGNIWSSRSWQHAYDVADAIWKMLNQEKFNINYHFDSFSIISSLQEYVVSSNKTHTVKDFIKLAFEQAQIEIVDANPDNLEPVLTDNSEQINFSLKDGTPIVVVTKEFYRPLDVTFLYGDASKIKRELGWSPKYNLSDIVREMVDYDIALLKNKAS